MIARVGSKTRVGTTIRSLSTEIRPQPTLHPSQSGLKPPHLLTLADLKVSQIQSLITSAIEFKRQCKAGAIPLEKANDKTITKSLENKTVALMFNKRSTRTRVASETSIKLLGTLS
jgi:ornithine carbamoyltransferase